MLFRYIVDLGIREYQMRPHSGPENQPLPGDKSQEELGIISHHGPMHPSYATPDARIRSFKEWPPGLKVQPKELVDAGNLLNFVLLNIDIYILSLYSF